METLLRALVPRDIEAGHRDQIILSMVESCNTRDEARLFAAVYRQFDNTEVSLENLIATKLTDLSNASREVLVELIKELGNDARVPVYIQLASEIAVAKEDTYRMDELLGAIYKISLEDQEALPEFFIDILWSLVATQEDSSVDLISRIFNLKPYGGANHSEWFSKIKQRISTNKFSDVPAYKCWVSWLAKGPLSGIRAYFQNPEYWNLVQTGITKTPRSTERIKYSLNILAFTLKSLEEAVNLDIMRWDPKSKLCRSLWTRYAALVEIISVDLSYNQAEESQDDVIALCQTVEFIPSSWALALLQSGLTTQAENIRNFIIQTIFNFNDFRLFNTDTLFIVQYLLPLACDSSKFTVKEEVECEYIGKLAELVSKITHDLELRERAQFLSQLLDYYQTQVYAYDIPRAIVLEATLEYELGFEDNSVLLKLSNYANSARRVSKSRAVGQILFDICLRGLRSLETGTLFEMLPKFFTSPSLYERLDLVVPFVKTDSGEKLLALVPKGALFYILYDKVGKKNGWRMPEITEFPEPVSTFLYDQASSAEISLVETATAAFEKHGFLDRKTMKALLLRNKPFSAHPTRTVGDLQEAIGKAQVALLSRSSEARESKCFEALVSKEFSSGYMSSEQRALVALHIEYTIDLIVPSSALTAENIHILQNCFSHDFVDTQLSVLRCIRRYLDSSYEVDLDGFTEAIGPMWEFLTENGLKATAREMQVEFIEVLLHQRVIEGAGDGIAPTVSDIIVNCHARKGLLCPLIRRFYCQREEKLPLWALSALVQAYTLIRTRHDVFYLEDILMRRYLDHSSMNKDLWHENERHARPLAIKTLETQKETEKVAGLILDEKRYHLFTPVNPHDGVEENKRILGFQILTLVHRGWSTEFLHGLLPELVRSVDQESSKTIRIYIEWLISSLVLRSPDLLQDVILAPLQNSQEPRFVSSLGRTGLLVAKALGARLPPNFITRYLNVVIPLATSNKAAVRHFSVAMIYAIYLDSELNSKLPEDLRQTVIGIAKGAEGSDQFKNFKQGDDCVWNISQDLNILGVCGGVITKLYQYDPNYTITRSELDFDEQEASKPTQPDQNISKFTTMTTIRDNIITDNIQTKAATDSEAKRTELIVVASLCDIPVNLGGICRLSDALGVKTLTLNDLSVRKNNQFKSTCVTADLWQPMIQVKEDDITEYLLEQKRNGYTLIGLEQTDNSHILRPSLKFPPKSLLLIGRERLGIPGNLLVHLDFCVEIEQWGMVRSMNVQTATAVIVHAYNNQH